MSGNNKYMELVLFLNELTHKEKQMHTQLNTMDTHLKPGQETLSSVLNLLDNLVCRKLDENQPCDNGPTEEQQAKAFDNARKRFVAWVNKLSVDYNTDNLMDELYDKFDSYLAAEWNKIYKKPTIDETPYNKLRQEINSLRLQVAILGDEAVRVKAMELAERIEKL